MESLQPEHEKQIRDFGLILSTVIGPDDMFPPDIGVREPLPNEPGPDVPRGACAIALSTSVVSAVCV